MALVIIMKFINIRVKDEYTEIIIIQKENNNETEQNTSGNSKTFAAIL